MRATIADWARSRDREYAGGKIARYYLAVTRQEEITLPVSRELGRPEHHEGRWVSLDEAARLFPPRLQSVLAWARDTLDQRPDR